MAFTSLGSIEYEDRYSKYATASVDRTLKLSSKSVDEMKKDLLRYIPEVAPAYFIDIDFDQDDLYD